MQTGEAALDEVSLSLVRARQLAIHAANEAANDEMMLQADQQEFDQIVASINRISKNTQYGKKFLLDGSGAGNGVVTHNAFILHQSKVPGNPGDYVPDDFRILAIPQGHRGETPEIPQTKRGESLIPLGLGTLC